MRYIATETIAVKKPVRRINFISNFCLKRNVIDLGALDETAFFLKKGQRNWLHSRIAELATKVVGLDNSKLISVEGIKTSDNSQIIKFDIGGLGNLGDTLKLSDFDLVVAGELIEHLANPQIFLSDLSRFNVKNIIISTPNACSLHNFILGMFRMESMHIDHVNIFSFKTLNTVLTRVGFEDFEIIPTYAEFYEMIASSTGPKKFLVVSFQRLINMLEWLFPLLSGGWIVVINRK
jgi:hypothetical protein